MLFRSTLAVRPVTGEHPVVAADQRPAPQPAPAKELPYSDTLSRVRAEDPSGPLLGQVPIPPSAKMPQTAPAPQTPGMGFASLINPMGTAHADETGPSMPEGVIPRLYHGYEPLRGTSQLAGLQAMKQLTPASELLPPDINQRGITGLNPETFTPPGFAGRRDLMGAKPQGFGTFGPSDFSPAA